MKQQRGYSLRQPSIQSMTLNHLAGMSRDRLLWVLLLLMSLLPAQFSLANPSIPAMTDEEALQLGESFGLVVGEVDEELRDYLGLQRAEGVVVFEVIGGKPADLAGIKAKSIIKEIDSKEIKNLTDFGNALKAALPIENFSLVTYQPADPSNQGISGGVQFHFVRVEKT